MLNFENMLYANAPSQLDRALESIDLTFDNLDQLLKADLSAFQSLEETVFIYFNREEVFYLNRKGSRLLKRRVATFDPPSSLASTPIFWLEPSLQRAADDLEVMMSGLPKGNVLELVSLSWGKTWMRGEKRPIRNREGRCFALLFSGHEISAAEQIERASTHCRITRKQPGHN